MGCGWQGAGASHTAVVVEFLELFMGADDSSPLQSLLFTKCRRLQSPALMPSSKIPTQQYLPNTEGDVRGGGGKLLGPSSVNVLIFSVLWSRRAVKKNSLRRLQLDRSIQYFYKEKFLNLYVLFSSVVDPDPNWIHSQEICGSVFRIRTRIHPSINWIN